MSCRTLRTRFLPLAVGSGVYNAGPAGSAAPVGAEIGLEKVLKIRREQLVLPES